MKQQRHLATDLDLHAVGWVTTRDAFAEIARVMVGRPRRIDRNTLRALGEQWGRLERVRRCDSPRVLAFGDGVLNPPLRPTTMEALEAFVGRLVTLCPGLYGADALHRRYVNACMQAIAGAVCAVIAYSLVSTPDSVASDAVLIFWTMALWFTITAIQLRRVRGLARAIVEEQSTVATHPSSEESRHAVEVERSSRGDADSHMADPQR